MVMPNPSPLVSIVMPAYNVAPTIEVAVRSALAQTMADFELVIVDDGSRDDTRRIAERLAEADRRIRVCPTPQNGGRMMAMNHGMAEARGTWIAVLDGDDWYAPERLEKLLAAARDDIDMIADDWIAVDSKAGLNLASPLPQGAGDRIIDLDAFLDGSNPTAKADLGMLKHMVRADFVRRTGITYYPKARTGEDFYFLLSYFLAGGRCLLLQAAYYYYVEPFGTVSRQWAQEGRKRYRFEVLVEVNEDFLALHGPAMTPRQRRRLAARTQGWLALIAMHQIREALAERRPGVALRKLLTAPRSFWHLAMLRALARVRQSALGPERKILGPMAMPTGSS